MSTPFRLEVPEQLLAEMIAHAQEESPNECCGLLSGRVEAAVGRVTHRYPLVNEAASPTEYLSEPKSLLAAHKHMRQNATDILAVYHSHPTSPPIPSRTDRERNYYPDVVHVIISLMADRPQVRGWWIDGDLVREAQMGPRPAEYQFSPNDPFWRESQMLKGIAPSAEQLETFDNEFAGREYSIEIVCPEFTSMCPKTGQPDFGTIRFTYTPAARCVELKSLKLYLHGFRDQGVFYEHLVNRLLDDFVAACAPVRCTVVGAFTPRGGITTTVTATYPPPFRSV